MMSHVMSDHVDWRSVSEDVIRSSVRGAVPVLACVVGNCGVRSPGMKPEALPFHPGATGEGKTGRVNASESSYAPLSAAPLASVFHRDWRHAAGDLQIDMARCT